MSCSWGILSKSGHDRSFTSSTSVVDDVVESDGDFVARIRSFGMAFYLGMESDDRRFGSDGQLDIRFGNFTHICGQNIEVDFSR